jgi:heme exporter protein C
LHPGNGGNPGFNNYDLDSTMRTVFYPAVLGWILLGVWMMTLKIRIEKIKRKTLTDD